MQQRSGGARAGGALGSPAKPFCQPPDCGRLNATTASAPARSLSSKPGNGGATGYNDRSDSIGHTRLS